MKNVIIPYSVAALQERDHIVYDKVNEKPVILKRGTYHAGSYDTSKYSLPHSQFMQLFNGKPISAPLDINGSAYWAQSSFYKITGLTYPATLNIDFYKTSDASTGKITTSVTGNDATSLAAAIKAIDSHIIKAEVLSNGIGVQCNSYNTSDLTNAIYGGMRFRITGSSAAKIDDTHVSIGNITLQMMDKVVYQCQPTKDIFRIKGIALPPAYIFPWSNDNRAVGPVFNLPKAVVYYSTNGKATFDKSSTMARAMFDSLAESTNAEQHAYWQSFGGSYETYVARLFTAIDDIRGCNTIFQNIRHLTDILGNMKTLDYKGEAVDTYPCMAKCLTYGFNDPVHAAGKWVGTDWLTMSMLMRRTGVDANNKTAWDREILLVGGSPTYGSRTSFWLPCCEYDALPGVLYYAVCGDWGCTTKYYSFSVAPFLASDF